MHTICQYFSRKNPATGDDPPDAINRIHILLKIDEQFSRYSKIDKQKNEVGGNITAAHIG